MAFVLPNSSDDMLEKVAQERDKAEKQEAKKQQMQIVNINIENLLDNPKNEGMSMNGWEALAEDILANGILSPVQVKKVDKNKYMILSGHRRVKASKYLVEQGYDEFKLVKCMIIGDDQDEREAWLANNLYSRNNTANDWLIMTEEAKKLYEEKKSQGVEVGARKEYIGTLMGVSPRTAQKIIKANEELTDEARVLVGDTQASVDVASIISEHTPEEQNEFVEYVKEKKLEKVVGTDVKNFFTEKAEKEEAEGKTVIAKTENITLDEVGEAVNKVNDLFSQTLSKINSYNAITNKRKLLRLYKMLNKLIKELDAIVNL